MIHLTLAKLSHVIITNEELHTDDQSFGLSTDYQLAASIQPAEISHKFHKFNILGLVTDFLDSIFSIL